MLLAHFFLVCLSKPQIGHLTKVVTGGAVFSDFGDGWSGIHGGFVWLLCPFKSYIMALLAHDKLRMRKQPVTYAADTWDIGPWRSPALSTRVCNATGVQISGLVCASGSKWKRE